MEIQSRSFLLPNIVTAFTHKANLTKIQYFTDCVFNPQIFSKLKIIAGIDYKQTQEQIMSPNKEQKHDKEQKNLKRYRIEMDFNFLIKTTEQYPKILDNIGIINFIFKSEGLKSNQHIMQEVEGLNNEKNGTQVERLGVLVTNQNNGDIYVSLIL